MWNGRMRHGGAIPEPALLRLVGCSLLLLASSVLTGTLIWEKSTSDQQAVRVAVQQASMRVRRHSRDAHSRDAWGRKLLQHSDESAEARAVLVELAYSEARNLQAASPLPHTLSLKNTRMPGAGKVAEGVEIGFGLMLGALDASETISRQFDYPYWDENMRIFVNHQQPSIEDEKLQELMKHLLPEKDIAEPYRSCAVVGNSGNLLLGDFGKTIDGHDAVFRVNGAPVGGAFKAHVGQKVTYRFLSYEWSYRYLSAANTSTQLPGETAVFYNAATMPAMYAMGTKQSERVLLLAPELTERSRQAYLTLSAALYDRGILVVPKEQNVPTAGWTALYAALAMCKEVDTYGFSSPIPDGTLNRYHDWGVAGREHNFRAQSFIVRLLEQSNHLRLCLPYHSSPDCHSGRSMR